MEATEPKDVPGEADQKEDGSKEPQEDTAGADVKEATEAAEPKDGKEPKEAKAGKEKKEKEPKEPKAAKASEMGCLNHEELNWIWIGDAEDARDAARLKKNNVRYVLNCTPARTDGGVMNFHERDSYFSYCRVAMGDNATENLSNRFQTAWDFFEKAHVREDGGILVHCQQGVSRSVSMVVSYLMKYYKMNFDECMALIKPMRPQAAPNEGFTQQLKQLWEKLEQTNGFEKRPTPQKRAAAVLAPDVGAPAKKRAVGVAMGPSAGPIGPARPGAARGPAMAPGGAAVGPAIGPARP
mmetsp:Transcript_59921/g.134652  ORF Transcript_59921/g.134652 Transcript_59921/m.134652 type:complete len:296 (+) Transcript_59921:49-936(+)